MTRQKIIAIAGPSASGKTSLAIKIAKILNGEIISVDSRQIYKKLNIGTAKPTKEEQQGIRHHLLDIVDITKEYTAANFCDDAVVSIDSILSKGKTPILAGGTGLYFRILLQDFDLPRVAPDYNLRNELEKQSCEMLYNKLSQLDIDSAKKIHPNNKVKIIRALEVCIISGIPMSKAQQKKDTVFNTLWIGLNSPDREFLYNRINKRVDIMFEKGLLNEAKNLFEKYGENKILTGTIGYKELLPLFKNEIDFNTVSTILKQNTRRYAKRQLSWFRANKHINWFDIKTFSQDKIIEKLNIS